MFGSSRFVACFKSAPEPGQRDQQNSRAALWRVSQAEAEAAVASLYADGLQPFGRILLKRLGELAVAARVGQEAFAELCRSGLPMRMVPMIDRAHLRRLCERCSTFSVHAEEGGEYTVFLVGRPATFVDTAAGDDAYPPALWAGLSEYFAPGGPGAKTPLPGGRYACALALAALQLPCLVDRSLGELSHVVQLAITQRELLGYADGVMVPHRLSEAVVKQRCAAEQRPVAAPKMQPAAAATTGGPAVASLEEARACLRVILGLDEGAEPCEVPLPNIKRFFRSRFQLVLSETAFGHTRLCDMLQDSAFSDLCTLRQQGNGYVVVPRPTAAAKDDQSEQDPAAGAHDGGRPQLCLEEPLALDELGAAPGLPLASPFLLSTPSPIYDWHAVSPAPLRRAVPEPMSPSMAGADASSSWEALCAALGVDAHVWRCETVGEVLDAAAPSSPSTSAAPPSPLHVLVPTIVSDEDDIDEEQPAAADGMPQVGDCAGSLSTMPIATPSPLLLDFDGWRTRAWASVEGHSSSDCGRSSGTTMEGCEDDAVSSPSLESTEERPPSVTADLGLEVLEDEDAGHGDFLPTPSPMIAGCGWLSAPQVAAADAAAAPGATVGLASAGVCPLAGPRLSWAPAACGPGFRGAQAAVRAR